jgi:lycopene cyclase domain-containing protein
VVLFAHIVVALVYTTPWDNYLVATRVWWYDPQRVTGVTLGWVPIEEYTFFVVQTLLTGLWLLTWMRHLQPPRDPPPLRGALRWISTALLGLLWIWALVVLVIGWLPGRYMALILIWALPPIMFQLGFGADILWRYRRLVLVGLLPPTFYLWVVDAIAIGAGVWTINPDDILGVYFGGVLPLEEATFFLVTTALVVFGMTLLLARDSHARVAGWSLVKRATERQA